jgi:hypothetical protein
MKPKAFIILVVICAVLGGAAYMMLQTKKADTAKPKLGEQIFSSLPINDVAAIYIDSKDESVSLKKGETVWVIEDRYNYPADFSKISDLVKKLKDVKSGRQFNISDETRARLALNSPEKTEISEDQKGTRLTLKDKTNKVLTDVIIGKAREATAGHGGHYLVKVDSETVHLVDKSFRYIETKPGQWIEKKLIDIKPADLEQVVCKDPGEEKNIFVLKRPEKDKDPEFIEPSEDIAGRTTKKPKITSLFNALSGMRIEDVADPQLGNDKTGFDDARYLSYHLFDGTVYKIYLGNKKEGEGDRYFFKVSVNYNPPESEKASGEQNTQGEGASAESPKEEGKIIPIAAEGAEEKTKAENEAKEEETKDEDLKSPEELTAEAEELNKKVEPWIYIISKWKFENFTTDLEMLFEKNEDEKTE